MAITVKHTKVSTIPDGDDSSLIRPSDWNADHTLVGLGTAAELDAGVANGVATLDGTGKVPISELPAAVIGALNYQGTWNASTNTPTLTSSVGTKGYYYVVNVAGTTNLDGITDWQVGDWVVFNGTVWQKVDNTDAGGDVVGPASATDNAITRFDGTTGRVIQNSTVTLDDNGNIINANSLGLDTTPATVPTTVGTMSWDDGDGVASVLLKGGNVNMQVGTQQYARVYNDSGTTLTKGQAVYISGAQGNRVAVKLARADVEATSFGTIGLVAETMTNGAEGFIIVSGALYKLNTTGLTAGATVYLSPTTAGAVTTTKPQAPDQLVVIGWVERVDNTVGSIYVKIDNGYELDELHDVQITSPQSGNLLIYDATTTPTGVWKNANLTDGTGITITEGAGSVTIANAGVTALSAGTGISVSGSTGSVTVTNTAPDQTVSLTGGTGISTSGTYPNFTITNTAPDQTVAIASGTGISVTGTYPNFTVANAGVTSFSAGTTGLTPSTGTTGAVTLAGTLAIANGGTGQTTQQTAINALAGAVTSGQYLRGNGTNVVMSAIQAADVPTLNQNTTGTASNVTGTVAIANGGTGATTAPNARTNLGATTVGSNMFTLTNPSAVTFPRFNADNTVSALDAATFRSAIGAGTGSGTVTSVGGTGTVSGISLSGTVTSSGNLTLGGTLDLSSPPTIGNTTPNTIAATTITATTSIMPAADNTGVVGDATTTWSNGQFTNMTIDSTLNVRAAIDLADSDVLRMGSSDDWQLFYNGTTNKGQVEMEAACLGIQFTDNGTELAYLEKSTGTFESKQLSASNGFVVNSNTVSASYSIPSGSSATSAGPMTVASGVTVTVPSGSRWVVL